MVAVIRGCCPVATSQHISSTLFLFRSALFGSSEPITRLARPLEEEQIPLTQLRNRVRRTVSFDTKNFAMKFRYTPRILKVHSLTYFLAQFLSQVQRGGRVVGRIHCVRTCIGYPRQVFTFAELVLILTDTMPSRNTSIISRSKSTRPSSSRMI